MSTEQGGADPVLEACLTFIGCAQYIPVFAENEIDFDAFKILDPIDLQELVPKLGPRKKILAEIKRIQQIDSSFENTAQAQVLVEKEPLPHPAPVTEVVLGNASEHAPTQASDLTAKSITANQKIESSLAKQDPSKKMSATDPPAPASILSKYGFALPTVGGFVMAVGIDTVKKHLIEKYTYPTFFGNKEETPKVQPTPEPTPAAPGAEVPPATDTVPEIGGRSLQQPVSDQPVVSPDMTDAPSEAIVTTDESAGDLFTFEEGGDGDAVNAVIDGVLSFF